ncbi:MAG: thiolase family protein [Oscillospiraceae bacterium]|nr:thiolase family protein [Oscillospiraceae bacterium]
MSELREAVIVAYGRSAIGKAKRGSLKDTRPEAFAGQVLKGVLAKVPSLDPKDIDDVILGCAFQEAEQGNNVARYTMLIAGIPKEVPAQTVNRFCSSGLQAIAMGANSIMAGQADIILAGGVESMSMIAMGGNLATTEVGLAQADPKAYTQMGITAENIAKRYNISREEQDVFGLMSHNRAEAAQVAGKFEDEIIPVDAVKVKMGKDGKVERYTEVFKKDEGIRCGLTMADMQKLKPAFIPKVGTVTAGNASQMNDAAAAVVIMSREKADELGLKPIARFVSFAVAGCEPDYMGIGPVYAIPKALKIAGMTKDDIDVFELNEAFASQAIACIKDLGLENRMDDVNPLGGGIALGHPLGCTGAFLTCKLLSELTRRGKKHGIVSMCIGGGMGAAGVFEMC